MSRPIDANALMQAMYHRAFETDGDTMWQSGCWVRYRAIEQVVKEQPTLEEPKTGSILCKDCLYARILDVDKDPDGYTCKFHPGVTWFEDSYCSWGKSRNDHK